MSKKYPGGFVTNLSPIGGNSVLFDGSGDFLSIPNNTALKLTTGDWTLEFWMLCTGAQSASSNAIWTQDNTGGYTGLSISANSSRQVQFTSSATGSTWDYLWQTIGTYTDNTWNHVAVTKSGSTVRGFFNGVLGLTINSFPATTYSTSDPSLIGLYSASYFNGYVSNFRIVKGTALYTANFTPPTQLLNVPNTSLLTCNSPRIVDQSSNNFTITVNGDTKVSTLIPFPALPFNPAPTSAFPLTPAPGIWTLDQALQYTQQGVWPTTALNAVEDVFSTFLYTGTGAAQTITNGIDLSGKGGLVWLKQRTGTSLQHVLYDTVRGSTSALFSSLDSNAVTSGGTYTTTFNSSGFTTNTSGGNVNNSSAANVSWTFREQPKFFDVVTYTGNNSSQTISHNLGSVPGCIIVKCVGGADPWFVYHRSLGTSQYLILNSTDGSQSSSGFWGSVTSTSFGTTAALNANGLQYVAYLFAHDAGGFGYSGTDNVISCGSFTSAGSTLSVNLGYEAQWLLVKNVAGPSNWTVMDNMRGASIVSFTPRLFPNSSGAENTNNIYATSTATGFNISNFAAGTYIYIAIRRGPMRVPSTGTSVFYPNTVAQTDQPISSNVPFAPDLISTFSRNGTDRSSVYDLFTMQDRLRGLGIPSDTFDSAATAPGLITTSTATEPASPGTYVQLRADGRNITRGSGWNSAGYGNWIYYFFQRAPGFFDVVCYTGTSANRTVTHNLGVVPELMIVKNRSIVENWGVYSATIGNTKRLRLNSTNAEVTASTEWNNTSPTATVFTVGTDDEVNASGSNYVAYLFATVPGVSKVGSYTGTGTTQTINCGFTAGSRFVMIKRTDSTGDWYVWDSARGIVAGNDPYLLMNSTAAEVTNTDYVDTANSGFEISSTAPAAINANGGTFIFLAIA